MFNHFSKNVTSMELIPSSGGVFEVTVNGEKVYSKQETDRFPEPGEVIKIMESK